MLTLKNPYAEQKRELIIKAGDNPSEEQKAQIEELEKKSREFVAQKINELDTKIETIREQKLEVSREYPKLSKQYKEMCRIYKECYALLLDIRNVKKELREEITKK